MSNKNTGNGHKRSSEMPDVSHIKNVEVTHEYSDISVSGVLTFMVVLTIGTLAVSIGMWVLFNYFNAQEQKEPGPGPMTLSKQERLPPGPRLQAAPGFAVALEKGQRVNLELREPQAEYLVVHKQWEQDLHEGARDESGNVVGMPIDEAMKEIVGKKQLPTRVSPAGSEWNPADYAIATPTAASSGRVTEKRLQ